MERGDLLLLLALWPKSGGADELVMRLIFDGQQNG
jgi:hypothetical protein